MAAMNVSPTTPLAKMIVESKDDIKEFRDFVELLCTKTKSMDINEKDDIGMTPLYFAASMGELEKTKILLDQGADPNIAENALGMTPLFHATGRYPNPEIATFLIEHGANVNHKSNTGATALHGACLQGNKDCIRILVKHGADPRATDDEGTTPLDLAKDNETREILHTKIRREDSKEDKIDEACKVCGKTEDELGVKLKRCSVCQAAWYCGKPCQIKDWKELGHKTSCEGFVMGYPGNPDGKYATSVSKVFGAKDPTVSMHQVFPGQKEHGAAKALKNKRFVVKVQIPLSPGMGSMVVYNENKSVHFFINSDTPGYFKLHKRIKDEGYMGAKGYFWAERTQQADGGVKVFHGRMAPLQRW